jgi:hypothetical protein
MSTTPVPTDGNIPYRVPTPPLLTSLHTHTTAADLAAGVVGRHITVYGPGNEWSVTGRLWQITYAAARIDEIALCDTRTAKVVGHLTVGLDVGPVSVEVPTDAHVVVHPEGAKP